MMINSIEPKEKISTFGVLAAVSFLLLIVPGAASAQWTTAGNDVYKTNTAGNVGIGTTSPERKLHIKDANPVEFENATSGKKWHIFTGDNGGNDLDFVETG